MGQFVVERTIAARPEVVFAWFADFRNAAKNIEDITKTEVLTESPVRVGTRFRETRVMFKKEHSEVMEVVELTPGKSYTLRCDSCGARCETQIRFEPTMGGTRVAMYTQWHALTIVAKLMSPLGFLMLGSLKKCLTKDLNDMARAIEGNGR